MDPLNAPRNSIGDRASPQSADSTRRPDLLISGDFTLYLIHATSPAGQAWLTERLPADAPRLGAAIAVEHRFIAEIVRGAIAAGLEVQ
jgi:hypothetical protein